MIILGLTSRSQHVATLPMVCPRCQHPAAHRLHRVQRRFTLFFVPLLTVSTRYQLDCTSCGAQYRYSRQEGAELAAQAAAPPAR